MAKSIETNKPNWAEMLTQALTMPGKLSTAYRVFRNYSTGNQVLATVQLMMRGMEISPIASFSKWKELGRSVKKGEKAIELCMPVTVKGKKEEGKSDNPDKPKSFMFFALRKNWFSLEQTEGADFQFEAKSPEWNKELALAKLEIQQVPFHHDSGNCQGYAQGKTVAVNPVAALPHKTLFHELAHVVLGHTGDASVMADTPEISRCIKEVEAEATAYLCCATLELPGMEESRGYIQHWLGDQEFPDASARRVFSAVDKILKAGSPATE